MTLRHAILRLGNNEQSHRLLEDFERMGLSGDASADDLIQRVGDRSLPWNIRSALLMTASVAAIEIVGDRLPSLLRTLLQRDWDFEELQVVESVWWMLLEFTKRAGFEDLLGLANRTLEKSLISKANNLENIASAVAETIVEKDLEDGSASLSHDTERWLSDLDHRYQLALRTNTVITPEGERFHQLATGRSVKPSRRVLSDWLLANVEPSDPPNDGPAKSADNSDALGGGRHR